MDPGPVVEREEEECEGAGVAEDDTELIDVEVWLPLDVTFKFLDEWEWELRPEFDSVDEDVFAVVVLGLLGVVGGSGW